MGSLQDLLRACPHHGFTELHQLDTFYNALNPADQDSLNSVAGGNLLERSTQDVLTIIENKSKVRNSRNKSVVSQVKSSDGYAAATDNLTIRVKLLSSSSMAIKQDHVFALRLELQEMSLFRLESSHSPLILSLLIMKASGPQLGRPFLRTARALIDVHGEEMILRDGVLVPLLLHTSPDFTALTSDYFLEEFVDELALITFPPENDDLPFDAESDL
ncbi:hypothetical protein Tco_0877747 [Tanacetum coccineum]|uniref:Reverse transcriptase domain-containing protein n=1 Tax=Tanacetum coccineum TaxID=301880 RepID=A0ABQ5BW04_9ASTR